jgi:dienelactone hydrolase
MPGTPFAYADRDVALEGYLARPPESTSKEKPPGVLIVPEWWGLNDYVRSRADRIAALGYVAFVADMYGKGFVTTEVKKASELASAFYGKPIMAERARAGLDAFLHTGLVDPARVAAIGYCFGGTTVQALAYTGAPLSGIVSFHGGLIPASAEAASRNRAKFLICHGAVDPFVPPDQVAAFQKSLDEGKIDYQFISYSGAVHAFTNPDADEAARANALTGKIGYDKSADYRSWAAMRSFFDEIFAGRA